LVAHLHTVMPGSLLGKALHYMSSQWGKLSLYVEDGLLNITQN
jgi:transposase